MDDGRVEGQIETIPIFPLSNVVLFPRGRVPLHIFEPRYRQMTAAALAGERRIGMVTVRPEHVADMHGDPPLFAVGCSGVIEQDRRLPDGRYDIVLVGTHRFRIVEELSPGPEGGYRIARVEALEDRFDPQSEGVPLQALRADVVDLLGNLLRHLAPAAAHRIDPRRFSGIDDETFVNILCQLLDLPAAEKQGLLDADRLKERCERLATVLRFRLAELDGGLSDSSGTVH